MHYSLRLKIQAGYFILLIPLLISLSLFYLGLYSIWQRIQVLELMDNVREKILEARRFEKNFLLYHHIDDLFKAEEFAKEVLKEVKVHERKFLKVSEPNLVYSFKKNLSSYLESIQKISNQGSAGSAINEREVKSLRKSGKELVKISNVVREKEVYVIDKTFKTIIHYLFILVVVSVGVIIGVGYLMSQTVVRPLKELKKCMEDFAYGKNPKPICPETQDEEIASVVKTLYFMLEELEARKEQLVQSRKLAALGTLLSGVAHELNTPLSNASSTCQIILEDLKELDPETLASMINQIDQEIWRARDIVRTLLEFSRNRHYEPRLWSLSQLIEETLIMARGKFSPKVMIEVDVPEGLNIYVDKQRFQQALLNLISNAIDAIGERGGVVKISAKEDLDRHGVVVVIQDNGSGIPYEIQDKIFDPFFSTKGTKGTGLGLYIVNEIVARHGGSINLQSKPGKGTTFSLFFPHKRE